MERIKSVLFNVCFFSNICRRKREDEIHGFIEQTGFIVERTDADVWANDEHLNWNRSFVSTTHRAAGACARREVKNHTFR